MPLYCQNKNNSCSACCGIYNIKFNYSELNHWMHQNTEIFLNTDISKAENIVTFRAEREKTIEDKKYREDIYVCPFVGFINDQKTGCLLHPKGSPHKQIHLWEHPQNFSFYGEGICLVYDCKNKEENLLEDFHSDFEGFSYGQITSNYNLNFLIRKISQVFSIDITKLYRVVQSFLETNNLPVTSFEVPYILKNSNKNEYWDILGTVLTKDSYILESLVISIQGIEIGRKLQKECE